MQQNKKMIQQGYNTVAKKTMESPVMRELDELISQVSTFDTLVLIRGESGSGKEVVARRIHEASPRAGKAFVPVNCGAIPADLLESELFGHEKGAFTGAVATRQGRFELAEGGTLFLDEIGDMSLPMQVKLLRVLQERCFERVGSNETKHCNVRILAATHRNLEDMVAEGTFRQDLFYRLDVFPIEVPALREHTEDVAALMSIFMEKLEAKGMRTPRFSTSAMRALKVYGWPGNIRELENLMERLSITHPGKLIGMNDLPKQFRTLGMVELKVNDERADQDALMTSLLARPSEDDFDVALEVSPANVKPPLPVEGIDLKSYLQDIEQWFISEALRKEDGVVTRAAQLLGLQRTTLAEKMKKLGVL
ncbi:Nif-specific regulatory protein [Zhongshania aliphaticivorans]|uniref:Nif-specific regulatory protein n=1 Tax=Zhongshania aliphaticivorans TaxID=1470434 RepID=A0A5S9NMS8_9GAMM|nr:sigma-54 dependent transcriptional regulator [Zhongshania aliphaticivorans]CAA0090786.1 Nif-specific regulatory protein [Zhongshania aliphaticivorans]CAA0098283.1 Nif-specific regulatory protein [Zhongshania aliphaticivorans]